MGLSPIETIALTLSLVCILLLYTICGIYRHTPTSPLPRIQLNQYEYQLDL